MMRPGTTAGVVLAATGAGATAGGVLRGAAQLYGAGPEDLLGAIALLAFALGLPRGSGVPRYPGWRGLLAFSPAALFAVADPIRQTLAGAGASLAGSAPAMEVASILILLTVLWVPASIARTALRPPGSVAPLMSAIGLAASMFLDPMVMLVVGGAALWCADQVPRPHRGWARPNPPSPRLLRAVAISLSAGAGALGWTALRGVFDPTPTGALLCIAASLVGAWLARVVGLNRAMAGVVCSALCSLIIFGLLGQGQHLVDMAGGVIASHPAGPTMLLLPLTGVGLLAGVGMGSACRPDRTTAWSVAVGAWLGPWFLAGTTGMWILGAVGTLAALSMSLPIVRIAGVLVATGAIVAASTATVPSPAHVGPGLLDHLENPTRWSALRALSVNKETVWRAWLPHGTVTLHTSDATRSSGLVPLAMDIDGIRLRSPTRASAAEELAGHLAGLLPGDSGHVVVLGDELGAALHGILAHKIGRVDVAVPFPGLLRDIAALDPIRRGEWLQPHVRLHSISAQRMIAATVATPAIVEISRAPWADGTRHGIDEHHLERIARRLGESGVYVLCTHLNRWPNGGPAALARALSATFEHVQVWLPPSGADSLIWVASDAPLAARRLVERFPVASAALDSLGYPAPAALLGSAILGTAGADAWGQGSGRLPAHHRLPRTLFRRPVFHAGALANGTDTPVDIWDMSDAQAVVEPTEAVLDARRMFLTILDDAARGQIGAAFEAARKLVAEHGSAGEAALEPLIDPHISDAWRAIEIGHREGVTSKAWADAQRFATTARMLAPHSPRPHLILGEIAIVRGDLSRGQQHYEQALERDPTHIPALDGLARIGRLRADHAQVEHSLRTATRHAPQDWRTWQNLGVYLLERDQLQVAEDSLQNAAGLAPDDEAAPLNGLAKVYLARGEATAALVRAERAVRIGGSGLSYYLRGRAHFDLERYDEAENDFRKAVLADPSQVEARGGIGQIRAIRGDYEGAATQFRAVLARAPNNAAARENLRRLAPLLPDTLGEEP